VEGGGLFFWLLIAAVAVLQGIGQKKKKAAQQGQKPVGPTGPSRIPVDRPDRTSLPSHPVEVAPPTGDDEGMGEVGSSETRLPTDVWAEILGLARGQPQQGGPQPPASPATTFSPREDRQPGEGRGPQEDWQATDDRPAAESPSVGVAQPEGRVPSVPLPASHGASASPRESFAADFESRIPMAAPSPWGREAGPRNGVRSGLFGQGTTKELRRAIILKEVLSPPLALRDE